MKNKVLALYDGTSPTDNTAHNYFGFGIAQDTLRFQASTNASHVFYGATSSTASNTLMTVAPSGTVTIGSTLVAPAIQCDNINNTGGITTQTFTSIGNMGTTKGNVSAGGSITCNGTMFCNGPMQSGNNGSFAGSLTSNGLVGTTLVTCTFGSGTGAGVGNGGRAAVTGTNLGGIIYISTGAAPNANANLMTVNFALVNGASPFANSSAISVVLFARTPSTAVMPIASNVYIQSYPDSGYSNTGFTVMANTTALTAYTPYAWSYQVTG